MKKVPFEQLFEFLPKSKRQAGTGLSDGLYPFYTSSNILTKYIDEFDYSGDCLIFGTGGNPSVHHQSGNFSSSTDCIVVRPQNNELLNAKYSYLFFRSNMNILEAGFKGAGLKHISKEYISNIKIPLPSLDDQIRITAVLTRAEKLIAKRNESIKALDEFLKSTFLEMFGDPVRNEKGWAIVSIQDLCSKIIDCPHSTPLYSDEKTGLYCIRSSDIQNGYLDLNTTSHVDLNTFNLRNLRHIPSFDDIVFTREGGRLGNSARVPKDLNVCLGQRIMLFQVDHKIATSVFLWASLNTSSIQQCISNLAGGGAAPRVNIKDLIKIKCCLPPLSYQNKFSKIVEKVESMKVKYNESLVELEKLYGGLSQRAFRGEL